MKVLLIDNVDGQLLALKQALTKSRTKFAHVTGLNAAVSALSQHQFNVVICAGRVDNSNGDTILEMVSKKFPAIVRILIDNSEQQTHSIAHYCFAQPLACHVIVSTITQLSNNNQAITKDIIVKTIANIKILPSPPKVYMQLNAILKERNTDSHKIAQIIQQDPMIAGLLHDIGKVVLFEVNEKSTALFFTHRINNDDNLALENKIFATDHCHVGGYLLHMWGFSYDIIEAIVLHHSPEKLRQKSFGIAQAVYLANVLINKQTPEAEFINHYKLTGVIDALTQRAEKLA